tara:strand:+ start:5967 stop:6518 length:552 start_codon:yes stop_codon:yes gene_type:complete
MIAECLIFLATLTPSADIVDKNFIEDYKWCDSIISRDVREHSELLIEFFDEPKQLSTAVKVIWCESRGNTNAVRTAEGNNDSGLFQFVPWTWNWIAEEYDLPKWDEWVIMRFGRPYTENKVYTNNYGFEQVRVQHSEYYNIYFGYLLSQDIYGRSQWRDWNSSKWCWNNDVKYITKLRKEQSW